MTTNNVGIQHSKDIPETDPDNDSHLHALELEGTSSKGAVDGLGTACETHSSGSNIHHLKIKLSTSLSKQCPACSSIFQSHLSLRNHLKNAHFDLEFLKCLHCSSEIYGNYEMFLDHLRSHLDQEGEEAATGSEAKTQECQVCHKQVRKINFLRHLASHKKVPCPECKTHILPHNLKRHVNDCHTRGRNYPCPDCPTMYHDASSLLSHRKRNHFGDETRHHLCKVCSKKFLSPSDLRIHMNGVHNNIKRFVCEFCGLGFKVSSALLYHRRLHTGERPHSCSKCERSFHIPSYLKRHLKRDHQEEYLGVYYKKGQPKSREDRSRARRHGSHLPSTAVPFINEPSISKQEVLEITVPTEMD
ncbi:zinc finger protein 699-like [Procambarus clarkii]|uniref:zinc finger protein 699-like n=1 Tax=Procambarus clarkii TaxID=6728 RepID=UPI001E677F58|nr:zinc finger protein 57-like [Procambarus clarkii]